jgi:predicted anti-sigma-YlaC factor YlaD
MIMECNNYQERMSLWIDNQLTQNEIREIEAHTAMCLTCRTSLEALKRLDRLLSAAPLVSPVPGFSNRFQARLAARHHRRRTWAGLLTLTGATLVLLLGAVAVLIVSGLALWGNLPISLISPQATSLLLDLGKAVAASLNLVWLIVSALARGLQHPAFIVFMAATAVLIAIWMQIVARRVFVRRPVSAN